MQTTETTAARERLHQRSFFLVVKLSCALIAFSISVNSFATVGIAQDDNPRFIARDVYRERLLQEGNSIVFCYNANGMTAEFEQDLARAIGGTLLIDTSTFPIPDTQITTPPLDHRLPLLPEQLYILLAENCGAFLGFALSTSNPDWLLVTRPYMTTRTVLVVAHTSYSALEDIPYDRPIGSRGLSVADNRLINFLEARPEPQRWRRFPYFSNDIVLERVADGTIGAGFVWEPALYFATDGDPEAAGFRVLPDMPFQAPPVEIGIATRSDNTYLNVLLGDAIAALLEDGTIDGLLRKHNLQPPRSIVDGR